MKSFIIVLIGFFILAGCQNEENVPTSASSQDPQVLDKKAKVVICHVTGSATNPYVTLEVSVNALDAHLAHGDFVADADGDGYTAVGACTGSADDCDDNNAAINPGADEVCDDGIDNNCDGDVDEDCEPEETIFAIAYTNVDGVDGFDESTGDVLIAKWVDGPEGGPDGVVGVGDFVVTDQFPTDVFAAGFGNFTVNKHVITGINFINSGVSVGGVNATNATFAFVNDGNREAYIERAVPQLYQPTGTTIEDRKGLGGVDTVHLGANSPSVPVPGGTTQFAGDGLTDSPHIDVDIFIP